MSPDVQREPGEPDGHSGAAQGRTAGCAWERPAWAEVLEKVQVANGISVWGNELVSGWLTARVTWTNHLSSLSLSFPPGTIRVFRHDALVGGSTAQSGVGAPGSSPSSPWLWRCGRDLTWRRGSAPELTRDIGHLWSLGAVARVPCDKAT